MTTDNSKRRPTKPARVSVGGSKKKRRQAEKRDKREEKRRLSAVAATDRLNHQKSPVDLTDSPEKASTSRSEHEAIDLCDSPVDSEQAALKDDDSGFVDAILPAPRPVVHSKPAALEVEVVRSKPAALAVDDTKPYATCHLQCDCLAVPRSEFCGFDAANFAQPWVDSHRERDGCSNAIIISDKDLECQCCSGVSISAGTSVWKRG